MTTDPRVTALAGRVRSLTDQIDTLGSALRLSETMNERVMDLERRLLEAERREREAVRAQQAAEHARDNELRAEYRRGYGTGFHAGRRNGERDPDQVKRRRRPTTIIPTLDGDRAA